ncbi:TetR/AcrR family transcriptional regulator [Stenotrophomonas maltophilia]|nr:TetR/AcrR family transcriptional regulator [Stenotrophomonas maltophilia]
MTPKSAVAPTSEDPAAAHAEAQRRRILDAAQKCFITRGFHAGSIGDIAAEAEISQGLMYRYFANKRALILALIERQLRHDQASISEMPAASDLVDGLLECYQQWARGEVLPIHGNAIASVALYAEINAEAHRDPELAAVLRTQDKQTSAAIQAWLRQRDASLGRALDEERIAGRTLLLRLLVEGLAMRAVRDPDLPPARVRTLLADAIGRVMGD